jgi:flagellar biosynthesis GTPase FlhF
MNFDEVGQEMSLECVKPRFEQYVVAVSGLVETAKAIVVKDDESLKTAIAIGGDAKKVAKALEANYKEVTNDASEFVKSVRGFVKSFTDSLEGAEVVIKKKVSDYQFQKELERRKQEEAARKAQQELQDRLNKEAEEANRKAREEAMRKAEEEARAQKASKAQIEAAKKAAAEEAEKHAIEAPTVPEMVFQRDEKATHTESGTSAHVRKTWKAEIVDGSLVPIAFCSPDIKKINEAVRGGTRTIPGVRIFEDSTTVLRT